ncbi:dynamin family protein [Litchfieldia salsa]|uniref:Dynamin family protein n=1 Tax=Litchfieldia salsa TaxID=930152 RepID=A0A1H0W4Z5_9BACI|nr:dynamin family protein [Litchfieldia salsa]SDP85804.1 Dynamin family protein [Litchfieldia salsa]
MHNYKEKQTQLLQQCQSLLTLIEEKIPHAPYKSTITDLLHDLQTDEHLITVLGEFKRGKSTLINALIEQPLLPSDVTPTTATINVIKHSDSNGMTVYMQDGEVIEDRLSSNHLKSFTFEEGSNLQDIHHIEIKLPYEHLDQKVVIVDTPGVGDLNEHRLDVTYSYIPRSTIVLFVFDATTPIRKSEVDYLTETVLKLAFGEIVFVANFIDRLDEEELEETMDYMKARLKKVMKDEPFKLFALSSKDALENPQNPEFKQLLSYLKSQSQQGRGSTFKLSFFEDRLTQLFHVVEDEIRQIEAIRQASNLELEQALSKITDFNKKSKEHEKTLSVYIASRKNEIIQLTNKSIEHFEEELKQNLHESIFMYDGPKFQTFVERNIPISIKHQLKGWVNSYTPQIETLIKKLEKEILNGFSTLFKQELAAIRIGNGSHSLDSMGLSIKTTANSSDASVTSGLITAGAGVVMVLLSGGLLLPVITLAGFPLLNKFLGEKKLEKVKEEVLPHIDQEVTSLIEKLKASTGEYISQEVDHLEKKAFIQFEEYVAAYKQSLELELAKREREHKQSLPEISLEELLSIKN